MNLATRIAADAGQPRAGGAAPLGLGPRSRVRILRLLGPAFIAAVAFIDPGNVATNVTAGADYRYLLLWTVLVASVVAALMQYLAAKLAAGTGASLASLCREHTGTRVRITLWLIAELVVAMTELAELVGGAVALNLLVGVPPFVGGLFVVVVTVAVMQLRLRGRAAFPAVVITLLFAVVGTFLFLFTGTSFDAGAAAAGLVPRFADGQSALLACGIVGATVMPHALFLHSSLVGGDDGMRGALRTQATLRFVRRDVIAAMGLAGVVNALILLVAADLPAGAGDTLAAVHSALGRTRGEVVALVFALALLASSLASACAGLYTGQAIMSEFLHRRSSLWLRRLVSTAPALVLLLLVGDPTKALVLSQVALSFGLPFALVPLAIFTARRSLMGSFVNRLTTTVIAWVVAGIVIVLNGYVAVQSVTG